MSSSCSHPSAAPPLQPMSPPPSAKQPESRQDIKPDDNIHSDDTTNPKHQDRCPDKAPRDDGDPPSLPPPPSSSPPTSPTSQFQPSPIRIPTATASSRVRHGHAHDDTTLSHSLHSLHSFASAASLTCPEHDPSPPPPRDDTTDRRGRYAPVHKIPSSSFSSSSSAAPALATGTVPTATAAPSRRPRLVRLEKGCQRADDAEEETMDSSMDDILGHLLAAKEVECGSGAGPGGGHTSWVLTDWEELEKVTDMGSTSTMGTLMGSITGSFTTGALVANGMRGSFNSGLKGSLTSPNGGGGENLKGSLVGRTGFVSRVDSIIETPGDVSSSSIFNGSESFFDLGVSAECVGARGEHGRKATNDTFQDDHLEEESSKVDVGANGQSTFEKTPTTSKKFTNVTKERNEKNNKTSHQSKKFPNCLNNSSNSSNTKTQKETNTINRQESVDDSYHETTRKPRMSVQEMLMMDFNRLSSSEHSKDDSHDGTTRTSERRAENSRGRRLERERKSEGGNTDFDDDVHSNEKEGDGEAKGRRHSSSSTGGGRRSGLMRKLSRRDVSLAYQSRDWNRNEGVGSGTAAAIDGSATGDCYAAGTSLSSNALANNDGDATATNPTTNSMKFPTFPTSTFRSSPTPQKRTAILHLPTPPPPISPSSSIE